MSTADPRTLDRESLIAEVLRLRTDLDAARVEAQDARAEARAVRADTRREVEAARAEGSEDLRALLEQERDRTAEWFAHHETLEDTLDYLTEEERNHTKVADLMDEVARLENRVARLDPPPPTRRLAATPEQEAAILRLREQGLSLRAIAEKVKVGLATVRSALKAKDKRRAATVRELSRDRAARYRRAAKAKRAEAEERAKLRASLMAKQATHDYVAAMPTKAPRITEV